MDITRQSTNDNKEKPLNSAKTILVVEQNVTTLMAELKKNGHIRKNLTQNGELQRYSRGTQKKNKNRLQKENKKFCLLVA